MIKEISSVNNQYVKDLLSLKDKNTRNELKLFLVEGYHLVEEALKHHLLDSVLSTDKEVLNNIDIANKYLVSDAVIKKLSTTKTPQNIIGVVKNNINTSFDTLLSKRDLFNLVDKNIDEQLSLYSFKDEPIKKLDVNTVNYMRNKFSDSYLFGDGLEVSHNILNKVRQLTK
jgi:tRNA G18 (ribose-2'-O)-methylase SpoU